MHAHALLIRDNAATLERREALARPSSWNPEARTIEAVVATSTPVARRDHRGEFDEVLDITGADLDALRGAHVLDSHNQNGGVASIIGVVQDAWREGDNIVVRMQLSDRPELAGVVRDIGAGIIRNVSVGYEPTEHRDGEAGGRRTRTVVKWRPREVSFVPVGADANARTRMHDSGRAVIDREIRALTTLAGVGTDVASDLIAREATIEQARAELFTAMVSRAQATPIRVVHTRSLDDPQQFIRAAGEALFTRVNPRHAPSGPAREFVGYSIPDIARECLRRAGESTAGFAAHAMVTRALGGLHTTSDFALILGDTVGRTMRDAYTAAPSGIRQLARETTAADFRAKSRLMLDTGGLTLEKVNEHGEFKSGTLAEAGESYKLDSFGRIFGITRQALVNDDVGAFSDMARKLGQAASAFEATFLVKLLEGAAGLGPVMSDTKALFHTDHGNRAGSGAAPGETTLAAARLAMRKQTGPGGALIAATPRFVLIPAELETSVEKLLTQIQATTTDDVNPFSRLTLIVEPRLSSATRWYVVADPAEIDGLEYAYLASEPGPQTETQAGFRIDGIEIKVRLDYGAGFIDWRGWHMNPGA